MEFIHLYLLFPAFQIIILFYMTDAFHWLDPCLYLLKLYKEIISMGAYRCPHWQVWIIASARKSCKARHSYSQLREIRERFFQDYIITESWYNQANSTTEQKHTNYFLQATVVINLCLSLWVELWKSVVLIIVWQRLCGPVRVRIAHCLSVCSCLVWH